MKKLMSQFLIDKQPLYKYFKNRIIKPDKATINIIPKITLMLVMIVFTLTLKEIPSEESKSTSKHFFDLYKCAQTELNIEEKQKIYDDMGKFMCKFIFENQSLYQYFKDKI
jgi:virulence-associated protein VapD